MTTIKNQIKVKRNKTKWYMLSLALFILIGAGLFANPVQATEQWSQYGKPGLVHSKKLGGFFYPYSVAIDNSGNMYVADTSNSRIQKLTAATGDWSQLGGTSGSGLGQFNNPAGVAVDSSGNVYVADTFNQRIQKLTAATGTWSSLGQSGNADGQFWNPAGVAVDSNGNVYVADTFNHRIQKLTATTEDWSQWAWSSLGQEGHGLGQFENPTGVAVDNNGNVYVADMFNHRIQKLTAATKDWSEWAWSSLGTSGSGAGEFSRPSGVTVDSSGNVYVADSSNNRIQKLTAATGAWSQLGSTYGSDLGEFNIPMGVAIDSSGNVYVADPNNHRIQKLTAATQAWSQWSVMGTTAGTAPGEFTYPTGVAVDSGGNMYVADRNNNRIQKLTAATGVWSQWGGSRGSGAGEFDNPTGVAVDSRGNMYVADSGNRRIQMLTAGVWSSLGAVGQFVSPSGVAIDSNGNVYVVDTGNGRIQKLTAATQAWSQLEDLAGSGLGQFNNPAGVAVDSNGNVYVADKNNNRIQKLTEATGAWSQLGGIRGSGLGQFANPTGVAIDSNGNVYVADMGNYRIQKLTAATGAWSQLGGQYGPDVSEFADPNGVAVDSYGNVYVADSSNHRIQKLVTTIVPKAPTGVMAAAGDQQATISFTAPADNGGSVITSYTVTANPGGKTGTGATSPITVTGLTNGTTYTFTVVAMNIEGNSVASSEVSVTPQPPLAGAPVLATPVAGNAQVALAWNPVNGSTGYRVYQSVNSATYGTEVTTVSGSVYNYNVTSLTNGTTYYFVVKAINGGGESGASNIVSATPQAPLPTSPELETPIAGNAQLALTWNPVNYSTGYRVYQSVNSSTNGTEVATVSGSVYNYTVTGLTNGKTYYFVVKAINGGGESGASNIVSAIPKTVPGVPTDITAVAGSGQAIISFKGPSDNGGSGITGYEVTTTPGNTIVTGTTSPITITGLSNGLTYTFTVKAINSEGSSAISVVSNPVIPWSSSGDKSSGSSGSTSSSDNTLTSTDGKLTLPVGNKGNVSLENGITIVIPADATDKELKITIEKVLQTQSLLMNQGVLASSVFEIMKNFPDNFNKPVTLTLAFDPANVQINQRVAVFYYDEAKNVWVEVEGSKVNGSTLTVEVNHFTKFAVFALSEAASTETKPSITFTDITGHWAESNIKQAVSGAIVTGYPDGTFKPNHTVTRAEFAVMLMNIMKLPGEGTKLSFLDSAKIGTWAQKAVAQAVQAGIINGYEDGSFRPDAEITRAEMAVILANALGRHSESNVATGFADDKSIPVWAKDGVAYVKKAGIVQGKGANEFAPQDHATRAEAVTVLLNMLAPKSK